MSDATVSASDPLNFVLDLDADKDPVLTLNVNGHAYARDPFLIFEKFEDLTQKKPVKPTAVAEAAIAAAQDPQQPAPTGPDITMYAAMRRAVGLSDLPPRKCLLIFIKLMEVMEGDPTMKKIRDINKKAEDEAAKSEAERNAAKK